MPSPLKPVCLSFEEIDDLIHSARTGDLESLRADITALSTAHNCSPSAVIQAAVDIEDESEDGTGACLLHWPAANGNIGLWRHGYFSHSIPLSFPLWLWIIEV